MNRNLKQSLFLSSGTIFNSLLGLVFYILVGRSLGVAGFGYFSYLLGLGLLAGELGDLGLSGALIRFVGKANFPKVFSVVLVERAVLSALLIGVSLFWREFFFSAVVASSMLFFQGLVSQTLLARQKYPQFVASNVLGNVSRLAAIFWLLQTANLTAQTALLSFAAANFLSIAVGWFWLRVKISLQGLEYGAIFRFSSWLAGSIGVASLASRIDTPVVYLLGGAAAAGIYSSAQKLTIVLPQIISSLDGVFAPKFSRASDFLANFRDYLFISLTFAVLLLFVLPVSNFVIVAIWGQSFAGALPVFQLLLVGFSLFLLAAPFSTSTIYRLGKSNYHFWVSGVQLVATLILYFSFVPALGAIGAGISFLIAQAVGLLLFAAIWLKSRSKLL